MKFSTFLLLTETNLPKFDYQSHQLHGDSKIILTLDSDVEFEVSIWWKGHEYAEIQFYQMKEGDILTRRDEKQKALSASEFIQLFSGIEQIIIDYLDRNTYIQSIKVHPEAIGQRSDIIDKRNRIDSGKESQFDPNKSNAYMQLFNYSRLKEMGYQISSVGENIFITRS